ncbi:MAG: hypothetical protein VYD87_00720 [Pseudomonadota bacterium]|nr:hypothetical protein [Pseudomonadota bacterium]MEE3098649.1 hypothetical protein [Pseudomonadota bacterium]
MGKKVWNQPVVSVVSVKSLTRGIDNLGEDGCLKSNMFDDACSAG